MSNGQNLWVGIGHLGADSDLRYTQNGRPVLSFRMACGERYRTKDGEWKENTEWVQCVCFGRRAEGLHEITKKGSRAHVTGRLHTRSYTGQDGVKRYTTEVRIIDFLPLSTPRGTQSSDEVPPPDQPREDEDF